MAGGTNSRIGKVNCSLLDYCRRQQKLLIALPRKIWVLFCSTSEGCEVKMVFDWELKVVTNYDIISFAPES